MPPVTMRGLANPSCCRYAGARSSFFDLRRVRRVQVLFQQEQCAALEICRVRTANLQTAVNVLRSGTLASWKRQQPLSFAYPLTEPAAA